ERVRLIRFKTLRFSNNLIFLAFNHFDTRRRSALLERRFFRRSFDNTTSTVRVVVKLISQRATPTTGTQLAFQQHHRRTLSHSRFQHRRFRSHRQRRHRTPHKPTHQHTTHNHDRQDRLTSTYRHNPSSKNDPHETRGTAGTTKPPWAPSPRRQKNMKRRDSDAEDQTGPYDRLEQRSGLKLAESHPGKRERERERRVSDADASYNGPAKTTRTLNNAIPQRKHAKNKPLSKNDPVPLPRALLYRYKSTTGANPKPDLMSARYPTGIRTWLFIPQAAPAVKSPTRETRLRPTGLGKLIALAQADAPVQTPQRPWCPPGPLPQTPHDRRHEQRAHDGRVDRDRQRRADAELLNEEDVRSGEGADRHAEQERGGGYEAPGALQAVGDRVACGETRVVGLLDASEQEHPVVGGERKGDDEQEHEVRLLEAA